MPERIIFTFLLAGLIVSCATTPKKNAPSSTPDSSAPELKLNDWVIVDEPQKVTVKNFSSTHPIAYMSSCNIHVGSTLRVLRFNETDILVTYERSNNEAMWINAPENNGSPECSEYTIFEVSKKEYHQIVKRQALNHAFILNQ